MRARFTVIKGSYPDDWAILPTITICFQKPRYILIGFLRWYIEIDFIQKYKSLK